MAVDPIAGEYAADTQIALQMELLVQLSVF